MEYRLGKLKDIEAILKLHAMYQVDTIAEEDKADGFITTSFSEEELTQLITFEQGLFVAEDQGEIVAYAMAASWVFWSKWPMFAHMIKALPGLSYHGIALTEENSYQYGPVCVRKDYRGKGVFQEIFEFALQAMSSRFEVLVTFINKINPRSYKAHVSKARLDVIQEFEYNNNQYFELACLTKR